MMRKVQLAVVLVALLAPTFAALCQWQCHFMSSPVSPVTHELLPPAGHRMECCANQELVLKKPAAELTSKVARSLDLPGKIQLQNLDSQVITHESPPGLALLPAFHSSPRILRI